jgi:hypothetical protein
VNRFAYSGLLAAALAVTACFSSGGEAGKGAATGGQPPAGGAGTAAAKALIDTRNPAVTETATFGLG